MMPKPIKQNRCIAVKKIRISPTPLKIRQETSQLATGSCYENALSFIFNLQVSGYDELRYVLGFRDNVISLEHAILRVGTAYYDPANNGITEQPLFSAMFELSLSQLDSYLLNNNGTPPSISDWIEWTAPPLPAFIPESLGYSLF